MADNLPSEPYWKLAETLEWIAFRDAVITGEVATEKDRPGDDVIVEIMIEIAHTTREVVDPHPAKRLLEALRRGDVLATGIRGGFEDGAKLSCRLWAYLEIGSHPGYGESGISACALPVDRRHSPSVGAFEPPAASGIPSRGWTNLRFKRKSIIRTFPEADISSGLQDQKPSQSPKLHARPQTARCESLLQELYPLGIPDRLKVTDVELHQKVGLLAASQKLPEPKKDSVLRAAGRRRN